MARRAPKPRPAAITLTVDVLQPMIVAIDEVAQPQSVGFRVQVGHECRPAGPAHGSSEVVEDDVAALSIQVHRAPGREEREVGANLVKNAAPLGINDRSQPVFEAELTTVLSDEVDHGQVTLAGSPTEAAAQLLREHRRRRRRSE